MTKIDILIAASRAVANSGLAGIGPLDLPQHIEKIEFPGLGRHSINQFHSDLLVPIRGGQRMISPRSVVETTVCVKKLKPA